jgi:hypothetical protein
VKPPHFIQAVTDFFETWFKYVAFQIKRGSISMTSPYSFPTMLRVGMTPTHYVAELLGVTDIVPATYNLRQPTTAEKIPNIQSFFNPGFHSHDSQSAVFKMSDKHITFRNVVFCTEYDEAVFLKKVINLSFSEYGFRFQAESGSTCEIPLIIRSSNDFLIFRNIVLIRTDSLRVLFRIVPTAIVVKRAVGEKELLEWLRTEASSCLEKGTDILGLNLNIDVSSANFARQLTSLADQKVTEHIIDKFIQTHANQFAKALGYKSARSQIQLEWLEGGSSVTPDNNPIRPDYFMEREDGFFDILDLKQALLKQSITVKAKPRGIRFNRYVSNLIAQLMDYRRYFDSKTNREWAYSNHGIKVNNPLLIGVVGNFDTYKEGKVDLALEPYRDNIVIHSYQNIVSLLHYR